MPKSKSKPAITHLVAIKERDVLCIWAACILRDPEPLTRCLKKILKPTAMRILRDGKKGAK